MSKRRSRKSAGSIFFITGVSSSGKTAVCDYLKGNAHKLGVGDFEIHDIDEDSVPEFGSPHWRKYRVDELLGNAKKLSAERSSIICGVIFPHEVVESDLFEHGLKAYFIMLDVSPQAISKRLIGRPARRIGGGKKARKAWIDHSIRISQKFKNQTLSQRNGFVVDTRNKSVKQTSEEIASLIKEIERRTK